MVSAKDSKRFAGLDRENKRNVKLQRCGGYGTLQRRGGAASTCAVVLG